MTRELYAPLPLSVLARTDLPPSAKLIYARLRLYTGTNADAFPSVTTLAVECGITPRCAMRSVARLEAAGLVTVQRTFGMGNRYHLTSVENVTGTQNVTSDKNGIGLVTKTAPPPVTISTPPPVTKTAPIKDVLKRSTEKRSEKIKSESPPIPELLDVPEFRTAWSEFGEHMKQHRKPLTPLAAKKELAALAEIGVERAVAAINYSIKSNYKTIWEKSNGARQHDNKHTGRVTDTPRRYGQGEVR